MLVTLVLATLMVVIVVSRGKANMAMALVSLVVMGALECVVTLHKRCVRVRTLQATVLHARLVMRAILKVEATGLGAWPMAPIISMGLMELAAGKIISASISAIGRVIQKLRVGG